MIKKMSLFFGFVAVLVISFQNCSPQHLGDATSMFSISSIYPYQEQPTYFDDVQITGKDFVGDTWSYQFIASVVHADQENSIIDVELTVLDEADQVVCPKVETQVTRGTNHIEISSCTSAVDYNLIKVEVKAALSGQNLAVLRVHSFEL